MVAKKLTLSEKVAVAFLTLLLAVNVLGFGLLAALSKNAITYNMNATHVLPSVVAPGESIADVTLLNGPAERAPFNKLAIDTRDFVMGKAISLPQDVSDQKGFSEQVMSHLREVRTVITYAWYVTIASIVLSLLALLMCLTKKRMRVFFTACLFAGVGMLVVFVVFGAAVAVNFSGLFENFHRLFFAEGSWVFAADSLLIRAFPLQFWMQEAIVWGIFSVLAAIIYLILGATGRKCVAPAGFSVN